MSRTEKYVRGSLWLLVGLFSLVLFAVLSNVSVQVSIQDPFLKIPLFVQAIWPIIGLFVACYGIAVLFGPIRDRQHKALTNASILFAAIIISAGVMEILARLILPQPRFDPRLAYYPYLNDKVTQTRGGREYETRYTTNEWGLRGDPPPENWEEAYTIITIGGSTTQDYYQDNANAWPALLESNLQDSLDTEDIWIGNAGLAGQTTYGHILVMDRMIRDLQPDAVIFLVGINDLELSLAEGEATKAGNNTDQDRAPLLFYSQLFRLGRRFVYKVGGKETIIYKNHDYFELTPVEPNTLTPLPDDLEEELPALNNYRDNLETLIDLAEELDVEILFLTQPLLYGDSEQWEKIYGMASTQEPRITISARTHWQFLDIYNQELLTICEERQIACYDLASDIPHDIKYFADEMHFTKKGSELVAEEVTEAALENLSIGAE